MTAQDLIDAYVNDVVRQLPRNLRKDVGLELRELLTEEHAVMQQAKDRAMEERETIAFLHEFGHPAEVAARYQPAGFTIIDPIYARSFLRAAIIGVLVLSALGLLAMLKDPAMAGMSFSVLLGRWWMHMLFGPLFWWPGFLLVCYGIATWSRRRWPQQARWKPEVGPSRRTLRIGTFASAPFFAAWLIFLISPAWFLGHLFLPGTDVSWAAYAEGFQQWRLAPLLLLLAAAFVLNIYVALQGTWHPTARWIDIGLALAIALVMAWSVAAGPILQFAPADGVVRFIFGVAVLIAILNAGLKAYRAIGRTRLPRHVPHHNGA